MKKSRCKKKDCSNDAISFSQYCGEHSEADEIVVKLNQLKAGVYGDIYLADVVLEGVNLKDIHFELVEWVDVEFNDSEFTKCHFFDCQLINTDFVGTQFLNCLFTVDTELQSSTLSDCYLEKVIFQDSSINQSSFQEGTRLVNCGFFDTGLIGAMFSDMEITSTCFKNAQFNQTSFNDCIIQTSKIEDSTVYKTTFWSNTFDEVLFKDVENDFDQLEDSIELCILTNTRFEDTFTPERLPRWNGINETPLDFYTRVITQVWNTPENQHLDYIGNLSAIEVAVEKLSKVSEPNELLKQRITNIFTAFFNQAKKHKDLKAFSKIAGYLSSIPKEWLTNVNQFLPSPVALPEESRLKLVFHLEALSLQKVKEIFEGLSELEKVCSDNDTRQLHIRDIRIGSVVIEIGSNIELIVLLVWALYKGANLVLDFQNKKLGVDKLRLEIEEKKKALNPSPEDLELKQLQKEKLKEEIKLLKQQQFEFLKKETKVEPGKLLNQEEEELALYWGTKLAEGVETLDLYATIIEESTK